jgi:DNA (cytosine-5)-methyltransferase 1
MKPSKRGGVSPTLNAFDNTGDSRATVLVLAYDPGVIGPLTATGMTRARGTESVESNHVLCFTAQRVGEPPRIYEDITPSLLSRMGTGGNNTPMIAFSHTQGLDPQPSEIASPTLRSNGAGMAALTESVVRRLTPIECERLMGWPDNHTLHRADGKTNSDSTRYKMCGNGVATPVAQWIADQLKELL